MSRLVIARVARSFLIYPLQVSQMRDNIVTVTTVTCKEQETRCGTSELLYAQETENLAVQDMSVDSAMAEVERVCSSETQHASSEFVQTEVEQVSSLETHAEMTTMEFFYMLMLEDDKVISRHTHRVIMDEGEVLLQDQSRHIHM